MVASWLAGCGHAAYPGATLTIRNASDEILCDVYLSQIPGQWAADQMEESERLHLYKTRSFGLTPGTWNVRADNCRGEMVFTRHGLKVFGHVLLQVRPVKASIDRKRGRRIAHGLRTRQAL